MRPVNNFLGQVIGNASEGKYNTVNNSSSGEVTFQKCLNSGITLFSSKNSNKSQTFATGAYQRLHEARPRRVVWLWEPEVIGTAYLPTVPNLAGQSRFFTMCPASRITQKMSRILLLVLIFTKTKPDNCYKFIILDFGTV